MDISLINLGKGIECYLVFPKRAKANFVLTPIVFDKVINHIDAQLRDIDRELSKFDFHDSSHSIPIDHVSHSARYLDQIHETHTAPVNEAPCIP